jgi:hypothetical protein
VLEWIGALVLGGFFLGSAAIPLVLGAGYSFLFIMPLIGIGFALRILCVLLRGSGKHPH